MSTSLFLTRLLRFLLYILQAGACYAFVGMILNEDPVFHTHLHGKISGPRLKCESHQCVDANGNIWGTRCILYLLRVSLF